MVTMHQTKDANILYKIQPLIKFSGGYNSKEIITKQSVEFRY